MDKIALRFGSYLAAAIEQNRRRSWTTSRILRLSRSRRWPEDEMQDVQVIFASLQRSFMNRARAWGEGPEGMLTDAVLQVREHLSACLIPLLRARGQGPVKYRVQFRGQVRRRLLRWDEPALDQWDRDIASCSEMKKRYYEVHDYAGPASSRQGRGAGPSFLAIRRAECYLSSLVEGAAAFPPVTLCGFFFEPPVSCVYN